MKCLTGSISVTKKKKKKGSNWCAYNFTQLKIALELEYEELKQQKVSALKKVINY